MSKSIPLQPLLILLTLGLFGLQDVYSQSLNRDRQNTGTSGIKAPDDLFFDCGEAYLPCINFENLSRPDQIPVPNGFIYISAGSNLGVRQPNILNSSNPPAGDADLGSPNSGFGGPGIGTGGAPSAPYPNFRPQGNVLIVQTPGSSIPNDLNEKGSFLYFDLSVLGGVTIRELSVIDIEDPQNAKIELFGASKELIASIPVPHTGNNGAASVDLTSYHNVFYFKVTIDGSGSVSSVCLNNPENEFGDPKIPSNTPKPYFSYFEDEFIYGDCGLKEIVRTWHLINGKGQKSKDVQNIYFKDQTPPVLIGELPGDLEVECAALPEPPVITAEDHCDPDVEVIFTETVLETQQGCDSPLKIQRQWTATDCSGNTVSHTQTINLKDTLAPIFDPDTPASLTLECQGEFSIPEPLVTDDCGGAVVLTYTDQFAGGAQSCLPDSKFTRTWIATDCFGNQTEFSQEITLQDTTAPVLLTPLETEITVNCSDIPAAPVLEFSDLCDLDLKVEFTEAIDPSGENSAVITRTWTVTDFCENQSIFQQRITVNQAGDTRSYTSTLCSEDAPIDLFEIISGDFSGDGQWIIAEGNQPLQGSEFDPGAGPGTYRYIYIPSGGLCQPSAQVTITVNEDCAVLPCSSLDDLVISKAVTPNGDGVNDYFTVKGSNESCGFRIKVRILNRWGEEVYRSDQYQNNWDGSGPGGRLPSGTYYYVVTLVDSGLEPVSGYFYLGTGSN